MGSIVMPAGFILTAVALFSCFFDGNWEKPAFYTFLFENWDGITLPEQNATGLVQAVHRILNLFSMPAARKLGCIPHAQTPLWTSRRIYHSCIYRYARPRQRSSRYQNIFSQKEHFSWPDDRRWKFKDPHCKNNNIHIPSLWGVVGKIIFINS